MNFHNAHQSIDQVLVNGSYDELINQKEVVVIKQGDKILPEHHNKMVLIKLKDTFNLAYIHKADNHNGKDVQLDMEIFATFYQEIVALVFADSFLVGAKLTLVEQKQNQGIENNEQTTKY